MIIPTTCFQSFSSKAKELKNIDNRKLTKTELVLAYTNEQDPYKKDIYLAAILTSYWYLVAYYFHMDEKIELFRYENALVDGVIKALSNRSWEDADCTLYGTEDAPEKIINRCVYSSVMRLFNESNRQKRRDTKYILSIDYHYGDEDEDNDTLADINFGGDASAISGAQDLVQALIKANRYIDALVIDVTTMCTNTTLRSIKAEVVKELSSLNKTYLDEFVNKYSSIDMEALTSTVNKLAHFAELDKGSSRRYRVTKAVTKVYNTLRKDSTLEVLRCN